MNRTSKTHILEYIRVFKDLTLYAKTEDFETAAVGLIDEDEQHDSTIVYAAINSEPYAFTSLTEIDEAYDNNEFDSNTYDVLQQCYNKPVNYNAIINLDDVYVFDGDQLRWSLTKLMRHYKISYYKTRWHKLLRIKSRNFDNVVFDVVDNNIRLYLDVYQINIPFTSRYPDIDNIVIIIIRNKTRHQNSRIVRY